MRRIFAATINHFTLVLSLLAILMTLTGCSTQSSAKPWHRIQLTQEFTTESLEQNPQRPYRWSDYLAQEEKLFTELANQLAGDDTTAGYRYEPSSPLYTLTQTPNWNRSFVLTPKTLRAGIVMLHGLTDSPYSVRALALALQQQGFLVIAPRIPGHGTLPSGLLDVKWEDWAAATRVAVQEMKRQLGDNPHFYMLGYSNGGALAVNYTLEALEDTDLPLPKKLVLLSPMIGISNAASFSKPLDSLGHLPLLSSKRWLSQIPEYNPFKYNSFPVNAGWQAHRISHHLQKKLARMAKADQLQQFPPVLTFQSLIDSTVKTVAVSEHFYRYLPQNQSELVMFDLNRHANLAPITKPAAISFFDKAFPPEIRAYDFVKISNLNTTTSQVGEFRQRAGSITTQERALDLHYPFGVFSLSHIAIPFPENDPTFGLQPNIDEFYGIRLGNLHLRGEKNTIIIKADAGMRLYSNPFYTYMQERIEHWLAVP